MGKYKNVDDKKLVPRKKQRGDQAQNLHRGTGDLAAGKKGKGTNTLLTREKGRERRETAIA